MLNITNWLKLICSMKALSVNEKMNFIGRKAEIEKLVTIEKSYKSNIIILYGRRRVGKTTLLERTFGKRNLLKFEGIEGYNGAKQLENLKAQLGIYLDDTTEIANVKTLREWMQLLSKCVIKGKWTIYFEEVQWIANYKDSFIAEVKYIWDNFLMHNPDLLLILCGSSASFMIGKVIHSKALYNRSQHEICLKEFTIQETKEFLKKKSDKEVFDAYLTIGGIPEYLDKIKEESSVFLSLCKNSFTSGSFFAREYNKIFISSLSENKYYRSIIELLSLKKFLNRQDLLKTLKISSGGSLSALLIDLETSGFIEKYHPINLTSTSTLVRYAIADNYLHFYFKFIKPIQDKIDNGDFDQRPTLAIKTDSYHKWLGFAFERWCRKNHSVIAKILGFSAVYYRSGVFFSKKTEEQDPGYQIDLVFDRDDNVYTICEIKYLQSKVSTSVIKDFEQKLNLFDPKKTKTIHKVLICSEGADNALINSSYFDDIITFSDLIM